MISIKHIDLKIKNIMSQERTIKFHNSLNKNNDNNFYVENKYNWVEFERCVDSIDGEYYILSPTKFLLAQGHFMPTYIVNDNNYGLFENLLICKLNIHGDPIKFYKDDVIARLISI